MLGFPCNQFGAQEPGSEEEIGTFCAKNYGVSFPMFAKIEVNGDGAHPLYKYLKQHAKGKSWAPRRSSGNSTKFLVSRDGEHIEALRADDHTGGTGEGYRGDALTHIRVPAQM